MCIRDRTGCGLSSSPGGGALRLRPPLAGGFQPCLLYTSDAADEEDSVDLGGGRIFQAEDGIRDRSPSRGLGDVYKRQNRLRLVFLTRRRGVKTPAAASGRLPA